MTELPIAPIKRIVKNVGAGRVSDDAAILLSKFLEEQGEELARKSISFAKHAGRKTVKASDVQLALKLKF